jgi:hypothetical protein
MSWLDLGSDGKHRIWSCNGCRRKAVTGDGVSEGALGKCSFCHPDVPDRPLPRKR